MKYRPNIDHYYLITLVVVSLLLCVPLIFGIVIEDVLQIILSCVFLFIIEFFFFTSFFGYVKLEEDYLFIKYGLIIYKKIPYDKIKELKKGRKWYSESLISLKMALNHIDIRYNTYDTTTISVKNEDELIMEINKKIEQKMEGQI